MSTIVVALGGNALGDTVTEQIAATHTAAVSIVDLVSDGHQVIVVHGNGPQVGAIKKAMDKGGMDMPLVECIAMSQGYIGYHLQQALQNELAARNINRQVATLLTQTVIDKQDPAFKAPTKPIGAYVDQAAAEKLMAETGKKYIDDAGRGWRWVVPSPKPIDIQEKAVIKQMVDQDFIVIACGGGGVPVTRDGTSVQGCDAVIDKDFSAAKLAELIQADVFFILTAVDRVMINFQKPNQQSLAQITTAEAETYISEGHFAPGSMLPKVEACVAFVKSGTGKKAIIGSLEQAAQAIRGESGTVIVR